MSIFVDQNETFTINVYYKENRNENGELENFDVCGEPKADYKQITAKFCQPSADVFGRILSEATIINHMNQKPIMKTDVLRTFILSTLMKEWSATNDSGDVVPINTSTVSNIHVKIANYLFLQYLKKSTLDVVLLNLTE